MGESYLEKQRVVKKKEKQDKLQKAGGGGESLSRWRQETINWCSFQGVERAGVPCAWVQWLVRKEKRRISEEKRTSPSVGL